MMSCYLAFAHSSPGAEVDKATQPILNPSGDPSVRSPLEIDRAGEMPDRGEPDPSLVPGTDDKPAAGRNGDYGVDDEKTIVDEPAKDIKVVRVKRKKKKDGEKRRKEVAE